jgi:hypothetical protein
MVIMILSNQATTNQNYNFYAAGSAPNYFAGNLTIADSPDFNAIGNSSADADGTGIKLLKEAITVARFSNTDTDALMFCNRITTSSTPYYIKFQKNGVDFDAIISDAGGVRFQSASDYRAKENITALPPATEAVKNLNPVIFNYIWSPGESRPGFIAHEVESVFPVAVTGTKDAVDEEGNPKYQSLDQTKLIPLLTKALQEALTEIDTLKARVTALES